MSAHLAPWKTCTLEHIDLFLKILKTKPAQLQVGQFTNRTNLPRKMSPQMPPKPHPKSKPATKKEDHFSSPVPKGYDSPQLSESANNNDVFDVPRTQDRANPQKDLPIFHWSPKSTPKKQQTIQLYEVSQKSSKESVGQKVGLRSLGSPKNLLKNILKAFYRFSQGLTETQIQTMLSDRRLRPNSILARTFSIVTKSKNQQIQEFFETVYGDINRIRFNKTLLTILCRKRVFKKVFCYWLEHLADYWIWRHCQIQEAWKGHHRLACKSILDYVLIEDLNLTFKISKYEKQLPLGVPERPFEIKEADKEGVGNESESELMAEDVGFQLQLVDPIFQDGALFYQNSIHI